MKFKSFLALSIALGVSANAYETPENIKNYYQQIYPQTESLETVATVSINGDSYYIIWGTSKAGEDGPDDTEGAFKLSPDGKITQIDQGIPAALPFFYMQDEEVWKPLVASFIQHEIAQAGSKEKFQKELEARQFIAAPLAKAYEAEGFTISPSTKLLKNVKGELVD